MALLPEKDEHGDDGQQCRHCIRDDELKEEKRLVRFYLKNVKNMVKLFFM
jgi:hypothetical protein